MGVGFQIDAVAASSSSSAAGAPSASGKSSSSVGVGAQPRNLVSSAPQVLQSRFRLASSIIFNLRPCRQFIVLLKLSITCWSFSNQAATSVMGSKSFIRPFTRLPTGTKRLGMNRLLLPFRLLIVLLLTRSQYLR